MDAYHNEDWPECYDLWVRHLFGSGPPEDKVIFCRVLQDVLRNKVQQQPPQPSAKPQYHNIIDIGTGTGRVLCDLLDFLSTPEALSAPATSFALASSGFRLWGTEPSASMLARAETLVTTHYNKLKGDPTQPARTHAPPFQLGWCQASAVDFSRTVRDTFGFRDDTFADLIIFAAGGMGHLESSEDVRSFLGEVADALKPGHGRATVSVLREFLPEGKRAEDTDNPDADVPAKESSKVDVSDQPFRVRSVDKPELVYVRYPATEHWSGDVMTDTFVLEVEDLEGKVLRSHRLEWKNRMFDRTAWDEALREAGLEVVELIEGKIQVWYVLKRAVPSKA